MCKNCIQRSCYSLCPRPVGSINNRLNNNRVIVHFVRNKFKNIWRISTIRAFVPCTRPKRKYVKSKVCYDLTDGEYIRLVLQPEIVANECIYLHDRVVSTSVAITTDTFLSIFIAGDFVDMTKRNSTVLPH